MTMRRETGPAPQALIIALAQAFRLTRPASLRPGANAHAQWRRDVAVVAGVLKSFNAALLRERFLADCGVKVAETGSEEKP